MKKGIENLRMDFKLEKNKIYKELVNRGLISFENLEIFSDRTRDANIRVLRDKVSEVIFLEEIRTSIEHYSEKLVSDFIRGSEAVVQTTSGIVSSADLDDADRRFDQFKDHLRDRTVCDFGTGRGLFLDHLVGHAKGVFGVELENDCIQAIRDRLGEAVRVAADIDALGVAFDVVTMFHVLEHIEDQVAYLSRIRGNMEKGGTIIIEVPHARDFLLDALRIPSFIDFTLWSEHLVLHTRESLSAVVRAAGFTNECVTGFQRYGLSNHLYWLRHGKPGGHEQFARFSRPDLDVSYATMLEDIDQTDSLICIAES